MTQKDVNIKDNSSRSYRKFDFKSTFEGHGGNINTEVNSVHDHRYKNLKFTPSRKSDSTSTPSGADAAMAMGFAVQGVGMGASIFETVFPFVLENRASKANSDFGGGSDSGSGFSADNTERSMNKTMSNLKKATTQAQTNGDVESLKSAIGQAKTSKGKYKGDLQNLATTICSSNANLDNIDKDIDGFKAQRKALPAARNKEIAESNAGFDKTINGLNQNLTSLESQLNAAKQSNDSDKVSELENKIQETKKQIDDQKQQKTAAAKAIKENYEKQDDALKASIDNSKESRGKLKDQVREYEKSQEDLQERMYELETEISAAKHSLTALENRNNPDNLFIDTNDVD